MKRENLIKEVMNLLDKHDFAELKVWLIQLNPVDIAEILAEVPDETLLMLFRILPKDLAADTFSEMDGDEQEKLLNNFTDQEVRDVVYEMGLDDTVDMLEEMPANVVRRVLSKASPEAGLNRYFLVPVQPPRHAKLCPAGRPLHIDGVSPAGQNLPCKNVEIACSNHVIFLCEHPLNFSKLP